MPEIAVVGVERASKARPVALCPSKPRRHSNEYEPSASFRVADSLEVGRFANCQTRRGSLRIGRWRCGTTAALFIGLASLDLAFGDPDYKELRAVHFCSDPRPKRNTSESASRSNTSWRTRWALIGNLSSFWAGLGYLYSITNLGFRAASQLPYCGPHAARRTAADDRCVDPRRCSVC